nr:mRNA capping enzyme [Cryptomonas curvata]
MSIKITNIFILLSGLPPKKICISCFYFLGTMPINFSRKHIKFLYSKDYFVFEKSDGVRGILTWFRSKIYLLDRKLILNRILKASVITNKNFLNIKTTLLDGELCFNLLIQNYEYLIYDLICLFGDWRISTWDMRGRLRAISYVIKKSNFFFNKSLIKLKKKDIFKIFEIQNLFFRIIQNKTSFERIYINCQIENNVICNKNDGLVFTPNKISYISKSPFITFKWKYENGNSIDFISNESTSLHKKKKLIIKKLGIYLRMRNKIQFKFKNIKKINSRCFLSIYSFKETKCNIGEYLFNKKNSEWCFIKNRKDKNAANSFKIAINTLEISNECFYKSEIIDNLYKISLRIRRGKDVKIYY